MELAEVWTCGNCHALNTGDVFYGVCWKCQISWEDAPVKMGHVEGAEVCQACETGDGEHTVECGRQAEEVS